MPNTEASLKPVERRKARNEGRTVVSHDFLDCSLAAQDFFEEGAPRFCTESAPRWPCCEGTTSLDDILESRHARHEHYIDGMPFGAAVLVRRRMGKSRLWSFGGSGAHGRYILMYHLTL